MLIIIIGMQNLISFKIILLGAQGVGKSSMIMRYIKGTFAEQYNVTVGVQYASKIVKIDAQTSIRLQIWDTAGQELFRSVVRSFYKGISAVFFIYAIDDASSFIELANWHRQILQNAHEEVVLFVVGSRSDMEENRKIGSDEATSFLKKIGGVFYIEVSSKADFNINVLFQRASETLYKKYIANGAFRNLVVPVRTSMYAPRSESMTLKREVIQDKKKDKKCC